MRVARDSSAAESGAAAAVVLIAIAALCLVVSTATVAVSLSVGESRSRSIADLAALFAADAARGLTPASSPCSLAEKVARENNARLTGCSLSASAEGVFITVEVAVDTGPFHAVGQSRAGDPALRHE